MSSISSGVGIASGLDIHSIIEQLLALEARRRLPFQARLSRITLTQAALQQSQASLQSLRGAVASLSQPATVAAMSATSSNPSILSVLGGVGAAAGSTSFIVARIAQGTHLVSSALGSAHAPIGAGALTLRFGAGSLIDDRPLAQLRGGEGIPRGRIRITDRAGAQATFDLRHAVSIGDVIQAINGSSAVQVEARLSADGRSLEIVDRSGGQGTLTVREWGGGTTAKALGILGSDIDADGVLAGELIAHLGASTLLADIGNGVAHAGGGADFVITVKGTKIPVSLAPGADGQPPAVTTLGQAITRINNALATAGFGSVAEVSIAPSGDRLRVQYSGSGSLSFGPAPAVTDSTPLEAAAGALTALGLAGVSITHTGPSGSSTQDGARILFGMNDVPLSQLEGGLGLSLKGSLVITDRAGRTAVVDGFGTLETVRDLLAHIRAATAAVAGMDLDIGLDPSTTRLRILDRADGAGSLQVSGAVAEQLGLASSGSMASVISRDLRRATVGSGTPLERVAGQKLSGSFRITNRSGASATITVTGSMTVADLARAIDAAGLGIQAAVNIWGDAIQFIDTSGGSGTMSVVDINGAAASALGLSGSSASGVIDGTRTRQQSLTGGETAAQIAAIVNGLAGVTAQIEVDEAGEQFLAIRGLLTGARNEVRLVIDGADLGLVQVTAASDARLILSPENEDGTLHASATNTISGLIEGVTLQLMHASTDLVTVTVSPSLQPIRSAVAAFAAALQSALAQLRAATAVDPTVGTRGPLYGNFAASSARDSLRSLVGGAFGPEGRRLSRLGITVSSSGDVSFDPEVLEQTLASDPDSVRAMLTGSNGVAQRFEAALAALVDPRGLLSADRERLSRVSDSTNSAIDRINAGLSRRRAILLARFTAMEAAIERLRKQQASLQSLLASVSE